MSEKSRPVMCTECSQPMQSPVCCAGCGALNLLPPSMFTYFELFSIEPTYDIDLGELRRRYLTLSRSIHPDVAGRDPGKQRNQSLALSSGLNRAYETLRNPVERSEYLLQMAGGPTAADDKSVSGELLGEVMMLREEIEEAIEADDQESLRSVRDMVLGRQRATLDEIADICRHSDLQDPATQKRVRQQLNAVKYWNNLLDQVPTHVEQ
jgi:molecular chaperone HscB